MEFETLLVQTEWSPDWSPSPSAKAPSTGGVQTERQLTRSRAAAVVASGLLLLAVLAMAASGSVGGGRIDSEDLVIESEDSSPCRIVEVDGIGEFVDKDRCDDRDKMPKACVTPGHNCSESKCCAWDGMACYEKDAAWASCRWKCVPGPDLAEADYNVWSCRALGPRTPGRVTEEDSTEDVPTPAWVGDRCAQDGEDCSKLQCCQARGHQCYEKVDGWAACMANCTPGPNFRDKEDQSSWSCKELGPRTPGEAEAPPPPVKYDELPPWVASSCAESGEEDCSSPRCCKESNMRCYEKTPGRAVCKEHCLPGVDPRDADGGSWSCKPLGPRTPKKCPACSPQAAVAPDVVIPVTETDLCKLKYTAESLAVNDPHGHLGNVYLLWMSPYNLAKYRGQINEALRLIRSGPHSKRTRLVDFAQHLHKEPKPLGSQQAQVLAKLKMAAVVQSDFYMVMDAKNTLIRPVTAETFFTDCHQALIQAAWSWYEIPDRDLHGYERSASILNLSKPETGFWPPATSTPALLHRQTVIDMLKMLGEEPSAEKLCTGPLCEQLGAFEDSGPLVTELTLYSLYAYAKRRHGELACIHHIDAPKRFSLEHSRDWPRQMQQQLRELGFPADLQQITVSSHDGYPLDWTPADMSTPPSEDKFPLKFEDLTAKWAAVLAPGEGSDATRLIEVNVHTLGDAVNKVRQFPVMFGAEPAALNPMNGSSKYDQAVGNLRQLYKTAGLNDVADDLVECVVGYSS